MKYKVIFWNNGGASDVDQGSGFTFYTFQSAHNCAQSWADRGALYYATLWDGELWRNYD